MGHKQSTMPRYQGIHGRGVVGGVIDTVQGDDPAAQSEAQITVEDNEIWELLLWTVEFTTGSSTADRKVRVEIEAPDDASAPNKRLFITKFTTKKADTSVDLFLAQWGHNPTDITISGEDNALRAPLPRKMMLPPGTTVKTITEGFQTGDNFGPPLMLVERFATS